MEFCNLADKEFKMPFLRKLNKLNKLNYKKMQEGNSTESGKQYMKKLEI